MKKIRLILVLFFAFISLSGSKRFNAEIEGGLLWQTRNDVQIPNTFDGTRFSIVELVGKGPLPWFRFYFKWNITERHNLHILLAPLSFTKSGVLNNDVKFEGETFQQGIETNATYKFNSWRLGYSYNICKSDKNNFKFWIGFTAKIRDAKIALEQPGVYSEKTDLGFVPLLRLGFEKKFIDKLGLVFDLEGLAGGPGRAFDGVFKIFYEPSEKFRISFGYRTVEGGADVPSVYNFGWIHYGLISFMYSF